MKDIHCHILPAVDDGAPDLSTSRQMLEIAWRDGIDTVIATPHYHPARGKNDVSGWRTALELVQREAAAIGSRLEVLPGCEVFYQQETADKLLSGEIWTLAGSRYVLVEFPFSSGSSYILNGLLSLRQYGFFPIMAHVERYPSLAEPEKIGELIRHGVCIQVNANAVECCGSFFRGRFLRTLLKKQYIHFIGTDAHDAENRPPRMRRSREYISRLCGDSYASEVCGGNLHKILQNERIL